MLKKDYEDLIIPKRVRVVIYCRVSTDKQEEDGTSLDSQEENCNKYALDEQYEIIAIFKEQYTGSLYRERELLSEVRDMARNREFDVLLLNTLDRLSRNQTHIAVLYDEMTHNGIKIECVKEPFEESASGKFLRNAFAFLAEVQREKTLGITEEGRIRRVVNDKKLMPGWKPTL